MRPIQNPPNPFESVEREWLEEPPDVQLEVYEERAKSILSENSSPDLGFRWSVNPYRGCMHACAYCLSGDTLILMSDGTTRPLARVRVGEEVYGTVAHGSRRRYTKKSRVLAHWSVAFRAEPQRGRVEEFLSRAGSEQS